MKLESIELENIRSYEQCVLRFPEGSILLSGDIGSGKSTLLLATEFALFGIRRGELSGESLLRRGKKSGLVRLTFSLDNREITVERKLRRTASSVGQESGSIITNGVRTDYTPTELKAQILSILGYPQDLLEKQKSLLYRYTVYTPQEQLKSIMWAKVEDRLNSLRKVFGVDRYRLIQENLVEFLRQLRAKKRLLAGIHDDLDEKLVAKSDLDEKLTEAKQQVADLIKEERKVKGELEKWKEEKKGIEEKARLYTEYDKKLATETERVKIVKAQLEDSARLGTSYRMAIDEIDKLKPPTDMTDEEIEKQVKGLDNRIMTCMTEPRGMNDTIDALLEKIDTAAQALEEKKEGKTQIETMLKGLKTGKKELKAAGETCPTCGKELDEEHRNRKLNEYDTQMGSLKQEQKELADKLETLTTEDKELNEKYNEEQHKLVQTLREEKDELGQLQKDLGEYSSKVGMREKYVEEAEKAEESQKKLAGDVEKLEETIRDFEEKLEGLADVEERKEKIEKHIEEVQSSLGDVRQELGSAKEAKKQLTPRIKEIDQEIKRKKSAREFEGNLSSFEGWLSIHLMNLAGTIETHYMVELKRRFDPLFSDWFNMLVDDEDMEARIDDEFTPVVEKEGYEAEYETLSGGEAASVALAYRLALNKVINTMVEEIKTRDIIILDEPTDGFSNAQMDKIRDIIEELGAGQTIIVSHEPKIESYVDNIVRIRKEDGLSTIHS